MTGTYASLEEDQYYKGLLNGLAAANNVKVQQKVRWLEAVSQGCCEMTNKYTVKNADTDEHLFNVQESGNCWNRCFCAPHHTFDLNIIPPGEPWGTESFVDGPVLMSREGCCGKCLGCFTCSETCQNTATVWPDADNAQTFRMEEKLCNGMSPEIVIYAVGGGPGGNSDLPMALLTAPCCFGGCYELCSDFFFSVSSIDPDTLQAVGESDIATIRKIRPRDCMSMCLECCTDIDNFELSFVESYAYNRDPNFKACILSALFYLDYMFFEMDNGICHADDNGLTITLFNCYCSGCICPCCITLKGGD